MTRHEAFLEALIAQLPGLRRYAVALTGSAARADDLVQDTIERALRQSGQLRELEKIARWLRSILRHLHIDEVRRNRVARLDCDDLNDHPELSTPASDNTAIRDFVRAMNRLSVEHREIILLVGIENLSYREIADELSIPMGTVMSRLARARERLRSLIEDGTSADIIPFSSRSGGTS